jgi:quinol monooxygenase YgiN
MSELLGIARFKFLEGKREEYLRLSDQALDIVRRTEPGTLGYDLYLNGDQSECMVIERYRDSEAAMWHAANLGDLFAPVLATVSVVQSEVSRQRRAGPLHAVPVDVSRLMVGGPAAVASPHGFSP